MRQCNTCNIQYCYLLLLSEPCYAIAMGQIIIIIIIIIIILELQQSILPLSIQTLVDKSTETAEITWAALSAVSKPVGQQCCIQKAWDGPVSANQVTRMLSSTSNDMDKARLLAASSPQPVTGSTHRR